MPEDVVGEWQLGRVVSAGAFAEVREAGSTTGEVAAIKRLHGHAAREREICELFAAECELTCALPPHPGLVRGRDAMPGAERPWLLMDLVRGGDLRGAVERGDATALDARALVASAAEAAAHLHAHGWVHGDLVPANLILRAGTETETASASAVVVCDLGITRRIGDGGPVRGTAAYMAPEQVHGDAWTAAVDVWALGVVLWELSTGERLFLRGASFLSMAAIVETEPPPLTDAALAPIVARALSRDPAARPGAAELAAALRG
ncbi:MAG TPA: protein kinase [Kofleriaceae bacterium]|nr:protein kinase [Kofleriaceae bacterium]